MIDCFGGGHYACAVTASVPTKGGESTSDTHTAIDSNTIRQFLVMVMILRPNSWVTRILIGIKNGISITLASRHVTRYQEMLLVIESYATCLILSNDDKINNIRTWLNVCRLLFLPTRFPWPSNTNYLQLNLIFQKSSFLLPQVDSSIDYTPCDY